MQPVVTVDEESLILELRSQGLNKDRIAIAVYGSRSAGNVAKVSYVVDEAPDEDEGEALDEDEGVEEIDRFCSHCGKYITGNYLTRQKTMTYDLGREGLKTYYPVPGQTVFIHARCLSTKNVNQYPPVGNYPPVPEDPDIVMRRESLERQARTGEAFVPNKYRKLTPEEVEEGYYLDVKAYGQEAADNMRSHREWIESQGGYEGLEAKREEERVRREAIQAKREAMGKVVVHKYGDSKFGNLTTITRNYATGTETVSRQVGGKTTKYNRPISKTVPRSVGVKTVPKLPKRKGIRGKLGI